MRLCGFCRGTGVNKEHVWPDWLRKIILDSRAVGRQKAFHAQIERGGSTSEFKNPSLEIKVGMPCSSCNGGWMSALENQVKPFVATMAYRGEQTLLDGDRQLALTRWIVKTAMVYEFTASPAEARYFSEFARATKPGRLQLHYPAPNGWVSWPPDITIDDEALDVLDTRCSKKFRQLGPQTLG